MASKPSHLANSDGSIAVVIHIDSISTYITNLAICLEDSLLVSCAQLYSRRIVAADCRRGDIAMNTPTINSGAAAHIHHTSGLMYTRNTARPSPLNSDGTMYKSSRGVLLIAARVAAILKS